MTWILGEDTQNEANLDDSARNMAKGLEAQRDGVAQSMALAAQKRQELEQAILQLERLRATAGALQSQKKDAEAYRVAQQIVTAESRLEGLATQFESLKQAANGNILRFRTNAEEVKARLNHVEDLKELQRINALRETAQKSFDSFDLDSPKAQFDATVRQIQGATHALDAKDLIDDLDGMQMDLTIRDQLDEGSVQAVLTGLKAQAALPSGESSGVEGSSRAKALLSAPTFETLGSRSFSPEERAPVPAKPVEEPKRLEDGSSE
jgi:hypothetical protein